MCMCGLMTCEKCRSFFVSLLLCCGRSTLIQEASNKNQDFQTAAQSLDFFLVNLSNNSIGPRDNVAEITAKHNSQKVSANVL